MKKILITAGPTYEAIDPVRFIGNRSSGKMGVAIAEEWLSRGENVTLILGPSAVKIKENANLNLIRVESSDQMYDAVMSEIDRANIGIFAAAVADYKPKIVAEEKIKKSDSEMSITLVKTKDILKEVGNRKKSDQFIVGFALETENEVENAKAKIVKKNLDMIVLNSLKNSGAGFQYDTNQISIIDKENKITNFELKSKDDVAKDIIDYIQQKMSCQE